MKNVILLKIQYFPSQKNFFEMSNFQFIKIPRFQFWDFFKKSKNLQFLWKNLNNHWFMVGALTQFFDFSKPWLRAKTGCMIFKNLWSRLRTGSLVPILELGLGSVLVPKPELVLNPVPFPVPNTKFHSFFTNWNQN